MPNKYTYRTYWSDDNGYYIARCLEFPSLTADGPTPEAAVRELSDLVDFCVNDMKKEGESIPIPFGDRKFSGEFRLRIPPQLHRELAVESEETGISLNQIVLSRLHPQVTNKLTRASAKHASGKDQHQQKRLSTVKNRR
ncbi:MAG: type II toxin-antitoxin system HicB family antitoxin [Deltaproteobacteria bacterium]|nr:type II toxin-antitoxin system HicB family antitoxin [Deltaproteobacteria bacterium]